MMKILQITIQAPGSRSGGEIGVRQTLLSLLGNGYEVDYVGPEIAEEAIRRLYHQLYELPAGHNKLLRIWDTLHGITNQRYRSWLELSKTLDFTQYDAIVMDFTKLDYALKQLPCDKVIVRAHNVEADYSARNYQFHKTAFNYLDKLLAARRERTILQKVKRLVVLTIEDEERFEELYYFKEMHICVDPVCIEGPDPTYLFDNRQQTIESDEKFTILLTGSLWFGPNYEGVRWFLKDVYPSLNFNKRVIIAGARPNDELKSMVSELEDVDIVDTPESMDPYFRAADLYVAPVFDGAGMKVKVAEAMSYGLPIVGMKHAFIGYEIEGIGGLHRCEDAAEMQNAICKYAEIDEEDYIEVRKGIRKLFDEKYSMKRSIKEFRSIVEDIVQSNSGERAK